MRVVLTNPFSWPEVRRGSERFINDLSEYLVKRGHTVTTITTHQGPDVSFEENGVTHIRVRYRLQKGFGRWLTGLHAFAVQCHRALLGLHADAIHCMTYYDGYAATRAFPKHSHTRIVLNVVGIPTRRYFRSIPHDRFMFECALRRADSIVASSRCSRDFLEREFGQHAHVLPPPVNLDRFSRQQPSSNGPPRFLFAGDVEERRKGAALLMRAFPAVREHIPNARLVFSGKVSASRQSNLLALVDPAHRGAVEFLGVGKQEDLPSLYSAASVAVLPAIWEAFGLALVEALACGTPVVGCEHGGISDIITSPDIGRMFPPGAIAIEPDNVVGLANALLECYALSKDPLTAGRCRKRASEFSWDRLGPELERLYQA